MPQLENPSALITGPGVAVVTIEPIDSDPGSGGMLVQTCYSLISPGTELAIFQHTHGSFADPDNLYVKYPFRPGYAAVGRVLAVGRGVTGFAEGDWIFYKGRHQAFVAVYPETEIVLRLPEGADPLQALFARMAQIAASASERTSAAEGSTVAVLGLGLVGNLAAQLFRQKGCDVLGLDLLPARCGIAERCGLRALPVNAENIAGQARAAFGEAGASTVVEATGHSQAVATALQMTARGGETILLGSTRGPVSLDVYKLIHAACLTVRGVHECSLALFGGPEKPRVLIRNSLEEIAAGRLAVGPLLSRVMNYREIAAAYRLLCDQPATTLSIVLEW